MYNSKQQRKQKIPRVVPPLRIKLTNETAETGGQPKNLDNEDLETSEAAYDSYQQAVDEMGPSHFEGLRGPLQVNLDEIPVEQFVTF